MTQGIYKLTNNINDKVYIGQSKDTDMRFESHMNMLWNRNHHSYKLQKFYNDNPGVKIGCECLEEVENEKYLLAREKYYIDLYDSCNNGFNVINPKDYDSENNKYTKFENAKDEFKYLADKYKDNLILKRSEYSYTMLDRINDCIKYFVKHYNLNDYMCEIKQYKYKIEFDVTGIYAHYYKKFTYNNDKNCVISKLESLKYSYIHKDIYLETPLMSKISDVQKFKRLYIWFIKQLSKSSDNMLQYIDNEDSTYYFVSYSNIKKYINYNGNNFSRDILSGSDVENIEKQFKIYHNYKENYFTINKPWELQAMAMKQKCINTTK